MKKLLVASILILTAIDSYADYESVSEDGTTIINAYDETIVRTKGISNSVSFNYRIANKAKDYIDIFETIFNCKTHYSQNKGYPAKYAAPNTLIRGAGDYACNFVGLNGTLEPEAADKVNTPNLSFKKIEESIVVSAIVEVAEENCPEANKHLMEVYKIVMPQIAKNFKAVGGNPSSLYKKAKMEVTADLEKVGKEKFCEESMEIYKTVNNIMYPSNQQQ